MKGKLSKNSIWSLTFVIDNFLAEGDGVQQALVHERIQISHANNIDEYNKLFLNLAARADEQ